VNYEKIDKKKHVLCKECYSRDKKTQMVWKFLAKLGKNPRFLPRFRCASSYRCATHEKGPPGFDCRHIDVMPYTGKVKEGKHKGKVYDGYKVYCGRAHPGQWDMPAEKRLRKQIFPSSGPNALAGIPSLTAPPNTNIPPQIPQMLIEMRKTVAHNIEKMQLAARLAKDPGLKAFLEAQVDMYKGLTGMIGG